MTIKTKVLPRLSLGLAASGVVAVMALAQGSSTIARTQVVGGQGGTCPVLLISLSQPMTLLGQTAQGDVVVVQLDDTAATTGPSETSPDVDIPDLGRAAITLSHGATGSTLTLRFSAAPAQVNVRQAGPASLVVAITPQGSQCGATAGPARSANDSGTSAPATTDAEALLSEARASLADGDAGHAVQVLSKLLSGPATPQSAAAREMLGLAHERSGQPAHAIAEYRTFLADYPNAEGAGRVRQRLLALETAEATPATPLREVDGVASATTPAGAPTALAGGEANPQITSIPRRNDSFPPLGPQPGLRGSRGSGGSIGTTADSGGTAEPEDNFEASVSLYYYFNQSSVLITELETNTTDESADLLQNALVFNLDMSDSKTKDGLTFDWRIAAEHEVDLIDSAGGGLSFSRAYGQLTWGEGGASVAVGRQSWSDDTTLGRYDGVRFTVPVGDGFRLGMVAGLDVGSTSDPLFAGASQVVGLTGEVLKLPGGIELTGFAFVTQTDGYTDRTEIGAEGSWAAENQSVYGLVDYNLVFGQLDAAKLTWSGQFANKTSLSLTADYSHSPGLALSNGLTGQTVTSLTALNGLYTMAEIEALAQDRTSAVSSFALTYAQPLSEKWTLSADASAYSTAAMPASGGVAAIPETGVQLYAGVQFTGTDVFKADDMMTLSARVSDSDTSRLLLLEGAWRVGVSDNLRVRPSLKLAKRWFGSGGTETFAMPSISLDYQMPKDTVLELDVGTRLSNQTVPGFAEETNEPWITAGISKQF